MTTWIEEPFIAGEVPAALSWTYLDGAGTAIDLTGYSTSFRYRARGAATGSTVAASVTDPANGEVETSANYIAAPTADTVYEGNFHTTNGTNTFISDRIRWVVKAAIPVA